MVMLLWLLMLLGMLLLRLRLLVVRVHVWAGVLAVHAELRFLLVGRAVGISRVRLRRRMGVVELGGRRLDLRRLHVVGGTGQVVSCANRGCAGEAGGGEGGLGADGEIRGCR